MKTVFLEFFAAICPLANLAALAGDGPPPWPAQIPPAPCNTCVTHSCQLVPEVKPIKKTVYEVQEVPYCLKKLPPLFSLFHSRDCNCDQCAECQCVRYKRVLVKKEVICGEICTTKCVPQEHHVPCQTCPPCGK
jgi:hypothetical protein